MLDKTPQSRRWMPRALAVFIGFTVIGFLLIAYEHRAHLLGVLPFLFLLACPLMHFLMPHGHGDHRRPDQSPLPTNVDRQDGGNRNA